MSRKSPPPRQSARRVGRPPAHEGKLALWIKKSGKSRLEVAGALGISRKYLDNICREIRRPSLEIALKIEKLTGREIPMSYLGALPRHEKP